MNLLDRGFRAAAKAALLSDVNQRVGAALLVKSRVVSVGWNTHKTHPKAPTEHTQHAEFNVLTGVNRAILPTAKLFVVRLGLSDQIRMAKPCGTCHKWLEAAGVKRLYFSSAHGVLERLRL